MSQYKTDDFSKKTGKLEDDTVFEWIIFILNT